MSALELLEGFEAEGFEFLYSLLENADGAELERLAIEFSEIGVDESTEAHEAVATRVLLLRAFARHFALTEPSARLPQKRFEAIGLEDVLGELHRHDAREPGAASAAELLAWILIGAIGSAWPATPPSVRQLLLSGVVVGAEAGGPLGGLWRLHVGRMLLAEEPVKASLVSNVLSVYAYKAGDEAVGAHDAMSIALAYQAIASAAALQPEDGDPEEKYLVYWRLAGFALDWRRHGGPPELATSAINAASIALALTSDVRRAFRARNTLARALTDRASLGRDEVAQNEALKAWRELAEEAQENFADEPRVVGGALLNYASELGVAGQRRQDKALVEDAVRVLDSLPPLAELDLEVEFFASRGNRLRTLYDLTGQRRYLDEAIHAADTAAGAASGLPGEVESRILNNLAVKLRERFNQFGDVRDIDRSIELQERALELVPVGWHEQTRWRGNLANAYRLRAEAAGARRDLVLARWHAWRALSQAEVGTHEHREILNTYLAAASASESLTRRQLDRLIDQARTLVAEPASAEDRANWLANAAALLATRCERTGDPADAEEALGLWEEALSGVELGSPDHLGLLTSMGSALALLGSITGENTYLERSVELQRQAVDVIIERGGEGPAAALALSNYSNALATEGLAHLDLGLIERAASLAEDALRISASGPRRVAAAGALGNALLSLFELQSKLHGGGERDVAERSLSAYRAAVSALDEGDPRRPAQIGNLANGLFQIGILTEDVEALNEATERYAEASAHPEIAGHSQRLVNLGFAALTLASIVERGGSRTRDLEVAEEAFSDARSGAGPYERSVRLRAAVGLARVGQARDDIDAVIANASDALSLARESIASGSLGYREAALRPLEQLPSVAALAFLDRGGPEEAINYLESSRALLLRDRLARAQEGMTSAERISAEDVCRLAGELGEPIVYLIASEDGGVGLVCREAGVQMIELPRLWRSEVSRAARALRFLSPGQPNESIAAFFSHVRVSCRALGIWAGDELSRLLRQDGALTLVPVGSLAHLPWNGTLIDDKPLIREGSIRLTQSVALVQGIRKRIQLTDGEPHAPHALVVASPDRPDMPPVEHALEEGKAVADALEARGYHVTRLFGGDATRNALLDALPGQTILHLACHATDRLRGSANALLLADGELDAEEMRGHFDYASPQLVYLSACSTGRSELELADEALSLGSALLAGGAHGVVSSLWPIGDEASVGLARAFYERLAAGETPASALIAAQLLVGLPDGRRVATHPWLWGGLAYSGV